MAKLGLPCSVPLTGVLAGLVMSKSEEPTQKDWDYLLALSSPSQWPELLDYADKEIRDQSTRLWSPYVKAAVEEDIESIHSFVTTDSWVKLVTQELIDVTSDEPYYEPITKSDIESSIASFKGQESMSDKLYKACAARGWEEISKEFGWSTLKLKPAVRELDFTMSELRLLALILNMKIGMVLNTDAAHSESDNTTNTKE